MGYLTDETDCWRISFANANAFVNPNRRATRAHDREIRRRFDGIARRHPAARQTRIAGYAPTPRSLLDRYRFKDETRPQIASEPAGAAMAPGGCPSVESDGPSAGFDNQPVGSV
ncbi:hypothetical protein [Hypericibacter sp.]|uniref:hypothetical protein n=1 Tax=Hypericibacter sp. TaxID=2705401 RepID=UPI003D6D1513